MSTKKDQRAIDKALRFGLRYGVSMTNAELKAALVHISVYSYQRGHAHDLCHELFFALDLAPRANETREVLYRYGGKVPKLGDSMISHLAGELEHVTCDQCILIASLIIANKIPIARRTGMRHLKSLLKLT